MVNNPVLFSGSIARKTNQEFIPNHRGGEKLEIGTYAEHKGGMAAAVLQIDLVLSRPETTLAVTRGAARLMVDLGYAPLLEVGLPNGRRADVMALGPRGDIVICEVKSGVEDYRVDRKWGEYGP